MRKLFTFIAAMLVAFAANAAVVNIDNSTPDALRLALAAADDGDEIVMAAGTYVESNADYIKIEGKSVIVRAAEEATVILQAKVPVVLMSGGRAEFIGIKFDASLLNSDPENPYAHAIYSGDNASGNKLILEGCEFYGFSVESGSFIHSSSEAKMDSCIVNNCYIHDITKSFLFFEEGSLIGIEVRNSTFANVAAGSASYYASLINPKCTGATALVDHCTFYNINVMNTDYGAVGNQQSPTTDVIVSNCIFMMPASYSGGRAVYVYGNGSPNCDIMNCLTYNYSKDSGTGLHSGPRISNCITGNPLFADAPNGDFTLGDGSPALDAGTDGKGIGDPRWIPNIVVVLPEFNFTEPYICDGPAAKLSGRISLNGDNYLVQDNNSDASLNGSALWKFHATGARKVNVTLNMNAESTSGHRYKVELLDVDNNPISEAFVEEPANSWAHVDINLGAISIPAEGDYAIRMTNSLAWSGSILESITLTPVFTVAGAEALCGTDWNPEDANNDMYVVGGAYKWSSGPVYFDGTSTWGFKITMDHAWAGAYPDENYNISSSWKLTEGAGYYNVEIAYVDAGEDRISVTAEYLYPKVEIGGDFNEWTMVEMTYKPAGYQMKALSIAAGTHEFKLKVNDAWMGYAGQITRLDCENKTFDSEAGNCLLIADGDGSYDFFYQAGALSVDYPTTFTRPAVVDQYQTLCVPFDASITGASAYEIIGVAGSKVTIDEFDAMLVAGHSYIVKPTAESMTISKVGEGDVVASPVFPDGNGTGLYGVLHEKFVYEYDGLDPYSNPNSNWSVYVLLAEDNMFHLVSTGSTATIAPTKAYLHIADPDPNAPALRIVMAENDATNVENIEANEEAMKFIKNGNLYIRKNGVVYTATGAAVK